MAEGWISLHRSIQSHWLWKDVPYDKLKAWLDLLMLANFEDKKTTYKGEIITLKRGDVNLSIAYLADRWRWDRKTVRNFLRLLEKDGMVITKTTTHGTTITIVNYDFFQDVGTTKRTAKRIANGTTKSQQDGQPSPTTNKENKGNNDNNSPYGEIIEHLNKMTGKNFKASSEKTKKLIHARLKEGFTLKDFKTVIDIKCAEWLHDEKMETYLRPETLFGTKFEGYLNQKGGKNDRRGEKGLESGMASEVPWSVFRGDFD